MKRIQRKRTKGWRMPENAVYVGRPTRWGNPFPVAGGWITAACLAYGYDPSEGWRRAMSVALYRSWMANVPVVPAMGAVIHMDPIELTEGTKGGSAWLAGVGTIDLPLRPDIEPLRGHDLACWCSLNGTIVPCHADVLLELANGEVDRLREPDGEAV